MIENKEVMARNIRYYMEQQHVRQTDICKACGFKQPTFSDWINGKTYPRIDSIEKMANYFGISKANLVEERTNDVYISEAEMQLLMEYRNADAITQVAVKRLLFIGTGGEINEN